MEEERSEKNESGNRMIAGRESMNTGYKEIRSRSCLKYSRRNYVIHCDRFTNRSGTNVAKESTFNSNGYLGCNLEHHLNIIGIEKIIINQLQKAMSRQKLMKKKS